MQQEQFLRILHEIPSQFNTFDPLIIYTTSTFKTSLAHLYAETIKHVDKPFLLILKSDENEVHLII